jgi:hypothetical protein
MGMWEVSRRILRVILTGELMSVMRKSEGC